MFTEARLSPASSPVLPLSILGANMHWTFRSEHNAWCLYAHGRLEISIPSLAVDNLCLLTGWDRRRTLAWVATRPTTPPPSQRGTRQLS